MMAAEALRAAADRLDSLAAAATGDSWQAVENYPDAWCVLPCWAQPPADLPGYVASESSTGDIEEADATWMATLGPQVAPALSGWLRAEAHRYDSPLHRDVAAGLITITVPNPLRADPPALVLARLILDTPGDGDV